MARLSQYLLVRLRVRRRRSPRLSRRYWSGLNALGELLVVLGAALALPALVGLMWLEVGPALSFLGTGAASALVGLALAHRYPSGEISWRAALVLCVLAWTGASLIGAIPLWLHSSLSYLDAIFESASGFTTTGMTVLIDLDVLPRSVLFWRAAMQWLGGLGILSFFLLVSFPGGEAYRLLVTEGPVTLVQRPAPGVRGTLIILWRIYAGLTGLNVLALLAVGVPPFDAVAHALTTASTGGFGTHEANMGYFVASGHGHAALIELVTVVFMLLSGMSFLNHHLALQGRFGPAATGIESRTYRGLLLAAVSVIVLESVAQPERGGVGVGWEGLGHTLRSGLFHCASMLSGAGFTTRPFAEWGQRPASLLVLLCLMLVGGCVGSTTGGIKVLRVVVLGRFLWHHIRRSTYPTRYVMPFTIERRQVAPEEVSRAVVVAFAWLALAGIGAVLTALLSPHGAMESLSAALSAVSNTGPCLLSPRQMADFGPMLKVVYVVLMLAGRLEIVPVLSLLCRRLWR